MAFDEEEEDPTDLDSSVWIPVFDPSKEDGTTPIIETDLAKLTEKEVFVRKAIFVSIHE